MSFRKGIRRLSLLTALLFSATLWMSPAVRAADSDLDLTFNRTGIVTTDHAPADVAQDLVIQPDGKIVVVGNTGLLSLGFGDMDIMVARYNVDGSLDTTFGTGGIATTDLGSMDDEASGVALQPDGRIVVAGTSGPQSNSAMTVVRYNTDGSLDTTFGAGGIVTMFIGIYTTADDLAIRPDGKIVVAGTSQADYGIPVTYTLARFNTDGSLDATFGAGGVFVTPDTPGSTPFRGGWARAVALQSDGKILVAGEGLEGDFHLLSVFSAVRYNMDGSLDSTFGSGGIVFVESLQEATDLAIQPDGKIVAVGVKVVGGTDFAVARFNPDGSPDTTFGTDGIVTTNIATDDRAEGVAVQPDGRIVVVGSNGSLFGEEVSEFAVVRYDPNGSLDTTFGIGGITTTAVGGGVSPAAVAFEPDGRIVAAGTGNYNFDWTTYLLLADFAVVRYGAPAPVNNPPVVTITGPASGSVYAVRTPIDFTGTFTDDAGDTHTATWTFDSVAIPAQVVEPSGSTPGLTGITATIGQAGVYRVQLTVTDNGGLSGTSTTVGGFEAMVVIYDPSAGWVTGGGWINSPAGALVPMPSLTGKANFGFVSKYNKGATVPTGNTEFQFKAGALNFKSTSYEWMVISGGRKAQYKGVGTINGSGEFRFMLTAIDGNQPGGDGHDKFRIKIWSDVNGLIYDNQLNDPDSNDPTTVLGGGSIVIHQ